MNQDDLYEEEYRLELEAAYRGWLHRWSSQWTARYFAIQPAFVENVYCALDRRWPGMKKRRLADPRPDLAWSPATRPPLSG